MFLFLSFITISKQAQAHTHDTTKRKATISCECMQHKSCDMFKYWLTRLPLPMLFRFSHCWQKKSFWFRSGDVSSRAKRIYFMENKFWPNWRDQRQNKRQTKYVTKKTVIEKQTKEIVCGLRLRSWSTKQRTPNGKVIKIFVFFIRPLFCEGGGGSVCESISVTLIEAYTLAHCIVCRPSTICKCCTR